MRTGKFACPNCGSENIQRCAMIYQNGTSRLQSTTMINGNVEAETSGVSSTNLAQEVAPPQKKDTHTILMVVLGIIAFLCLDGGTFVGALVFGGLAYLTYNSNKEASEYNEKEFPALYDEWQHSYVCYRCGNRFTIR